MTSICVFCSSSQNLADKYVRAAEETGRLIGERGCNLVYGGSDRGLMGVVAKATKTHGAKNGSRVIGVLPKIFEHLARGEDELIATQNLRDRKIEMEMRSDAFITLTGGLGTLDEFGDITTTRLLKIHEKPSVIVNTDGFYDDLFKQIARMRNDGFVTHGDHEVFKVVSTPKAAMDYIDSRISKK